MDSPLASKMPAAEAVFEGGLFIRLLEKTRLLNSARKLILNLQRVLVLLLMSKFFKDLCRPLNFRDTKKSK